MTEKNYAEDLNYWKTSTITPDSWLDKCEAEIQKAGGYVKSRAIASQDGKSAVLLEFVLGGDTYRAVWEVLPTKSGKDINAAKIQAATMLYHDIKNSCVKAKARGFRRAFAEYLMLPTGKTVADAVRAELIQFPDLLALPEVTGEVVR